MPGAYIGAALLPAAVIALLFFFDHSVSAQLAQQPEYRVGQLRQRDVDDRRSRTNGLTN